MNSEIAWIEATWARMELDNPSQTILNAPLRRPIGGNIGISTQEEDHHGKGEQGTLFS
jgi:hypothetical protein